MTFELLITNFEDHQQQLYQVRHQVFVTEQNVPADIELDDRDAKCRHALILIDGDPVATGRIDLEQQGRIGRVAVMKNTREFGLGRQIMEALEREARQAGLAQVYLHAQDSAVGFYEKLGYEIHGESFMEAGILHKPMDKKL
ncbi:GNAT family N-acetyltransferase [Aestuariicella hydrocarbonica]|uniref:GNAT family N-acetyltransferase n=1 Tax=Pseudomaricurvus hydrocarbonicus TaxID=1470433 RepID=A0A9E5JRU0_9GAMM|nr:GNAT family N-acetyltransferase [Aestuariicella hydrocarbonica]NHO64216.1 GNAT family N-acetyltransferase [Aestuariicella hydrocarbonica]